MKKLLIRLFLIFFLISPSVFAEEISDFQIEGIAIGDSLLLYFSEEEILENQRSYNEEKKFISSEFAINSSQYDSIGTYYKNNDKEYTIYGVLGFISYEETNIKNCYSKEKEIIKSFVDLQNDNNFNYTEYKDDDGFFTFNSIAINTGSIKVSCYDWNLATEKKFNWIDHFRIDIYSNELNDWFNEIDPIYND